MTRPALAADATPEIEAMPVEGWRRMTPTEKAAVITGLTRATFDSPSRASGSGIPTRSHASSSCVALFSYTVANSGRATRQRTRELVAPPRTFRFRSALVSAALECPTGSGAMFWRSSGRREPYWIGTTSANAPVLGVDDLRARALAED